ncbi:uncharacterized protein LOC120186075 [Hibiscus syriacus]|nr:uncharacterized protein LOC120186075 [Hibiscus syriacus]
MYRSMRSDLGREDRSSTHQRRQCVENHDGCVDEVNDHMGFHSASKTTEEQEESDSHRCSLRRSKRARMESTRSTITDETMSIPYSFDDHLHTMGIKQPLPFSFRYSVEQPNYHKVGKVGVEHEDEQDGEHVKLNVKRSCIQHDKEEEEEGCELSLSLSLQHLPSSQRSNTSCTSEMSSSKGFSSSSYSNYKDRSIPRSLNLDLSIALCGN